MQKARAAAGLSLVVSLLCLVVAIPVAMAASISNGGFETGSFTGWTVYDQPGGTGSWFVYSGTSSPLTANSIPPPAEGAFAATTDQNGPGSHILYRDVSLEPATKFALNFTLGYENGASDFFAPDTLDLNAPVPDQQFRVDIMRPSAPVDSVVAGDVLATVFQTRAGDALTRAPSAVTFDLSPFAGQTVRLRFAEVDKLGFLLAQLDAVSIVSRPGVACDHSISSTTPGSLVLGKGSWCIAGARVAGAIRILPGASVFMSNSTVAGGISSNGASSVALCGVRAGASVDIAGSTGFVLIGDPDDDRCTGNGIAGSVTLTNNHGGLDVVGNHIGGALTVTGTSGAGPYPDDTRPEIEANTIHFGHS